MLQSDKVKGGENMKDLEVYENEIEIYADDYIKSLANEDDIYKVSTFKGMLKHLKLKRMRKHGIN